MLAQDKQNMARAQTNSGMYGNTDALSFTPAPRQTRNILKDLSFLEGGSEVILLDDPLLPFQIDVHCVVEDTLSSLPLYTRLGYTIAVEPFDVDVGRCAILQDARGVRICLFEKMLSATRK